MAPIVHGLEEKYGGHINFAFLDIDDPNTEALQQGVFYDRRWRPYIMLVDGDGNVVVDENGNKYIWIGVVPGEVLEQAIRSVLGW